MKSCCFTGHRILANADITTLEKKLTETIRTLYEEGITHYYCGGAIGFDTLAACMVLQLKESLPDLRLHMILPCRGQDKKWTFSQKQSYARILQAADDTLFLAESYDSGCMRRRNRYLVDHADVCIAHYKGTPGGTAYTVNYAYQNGLRLIIL